jgi:hypothetical protein
MIHDLETFNPADEDSLQWSNIRIAKVQFHQIKLKPEAGVHNNQ